VLIETYPNYYGIAPDLSVFKEFIGADTADVDTTDTTGVDTTGVDTTDADTADAGAGPILLTDEAHGSHFHVCPGGPPTALASGASVTVQSAHKTLSALTQASLLHVSSRAGQLVPLIDRALVLTQTTSPSPLLLASLEASVKH